MTPAAKIATAVDKMWGGNTSWCHHIAAIYLVASRECDPSPERDAIIEHVSQMHEQVKRMCTSYDRLRSLTGTLERISGIESPIFYVDEAAGDRPKSFCPVLGEMTQTTPISIS